MYELSGASEGCFDYKITLGIDYKIMVSFHYEFLSVVWIGPFGLVELLASLAAWNKHRDRPNSNTENTNEEFRKDIEN